MYLNFSKKKGRTYVQNGLYVTHVLEWSLRPLSEQYKDFCLAVVLAVLALHRARRTAQLVVDCAAIV